MTKSEKVVYLIDALEGLYPEPSIPLRHTDAYSMLVAVMLSAQTTDKKVNEVTPALFALADNPFDMAGRTEAEIKAVIKEIGLANSKARNLKKLSQQLVERHAGSVPENFEDLERLAGVGHKTASVVMSQVFGHPAFPVDTHIHRLLWRWGLSDGKRVEQTERDAKRLFPKARWNVLHLQIIYYGRAYSPARGWDISKDVITQKIGRKSLLREIGFL